MSSLLKVTFVELKLFLRDPAWAVFSVVLPTVLLVVFGSLPNLSEPSEDFGGLRFIDVWLPSLVVITLSILSLQALPGYLASYREKGILRRFATTPVHPSRLLLAQLTTNLIAAIVAVLLLIAVGALGFDVPLPQHLLSFLASFLLGTAALFTLGLLAAAVAPSARAAGAIAMLFFFPVMFFGGVYFPRELLPDLIARIGDYLPPGTQALQDSWIGTGAQPLQLLVMAAITIVGAIAASRLFRWE
jgi:ABC-2 type transport system permease protein